MAIAINSIMKIITKIEYINPTHDLQHLSLSSILSLSSSSRTLHRLSSLSPASGGACARVPAPEDLSSLVPLFPFAVRRLFVFLAKMLVDLQWGCDQV